MDRGWNRSPTSSDAGVAAADTLWFLSPVGKELVSRSRLGSPCQGLGMVWGEPAHGAAEPQAPGQAQREKAGDSELQN